MSIYFNEAFQVEESLDLQKYIQENYMAVLESFKGKTYLTEADTDRLRKTADDFIEDAKDYLAIEITEKNKRKKLSEGFMLANLGLYVAGTLLAAAIPILGIITLVASIIAGCISIYNSVKFSQSIDKLKKLRSDALNLKLKTDNPKERQKLDDIVDRINSEIN